MKVTVITQAYNCSKYVRRTVESVLNQTYVDFEYILYDNGSTDETRQILEEYALQDDRIKLLRAEENYRGVKWCDILLKEGTGEYFTELDSDDWLEPNYLERLVELAESGEYDFICTGSYFHLESTGKICVSSCNQRMVYERKDFGEVFCDIQRFLFVYWAKLISMRAFRSAELVKDLKKTGLSFFSIDGVICLSLLKNCKKICIDNSILHHYIFHDTSTSFQYDSLRFDGAVYYLKYCFDFLYSYGPMSIQNMVQAFVVYADQTGDAVKIVHRTDQLEDFEKMAEYKRILTHELTQLVYRYNDERILGLKANAAFLTLDCAARIKAVDNPDFEAIKAVWFPNCGRALTLQNARLYLKENGLFNALLQDDKLALSVNLMALSAERKYADQFDLIGTAHSLLS